MSIDDHVYLGAKTVTSVEAVSKRSPVDPVQYKQTVRVIAGHGADLDVNDTNTTIRISHPIVRADRTGCAEYRHPYRGIEQVI